MTPPRGGARLWTAVLIVLAAWSLLPIAVWWDGARLDYFSGAWQTWGWGSLLTGLVVALAVILTRGRVVVAVLAVWRRIMALPAPRFTAGAALVLAALSVAATLLMFAGNPRNVDGFAYLFQARIFLAGHVWAAPPPEVASFGTLHMIVGPERWFSQYPPGQPAILAAGLALGRWWLLNPLFAVLLMWSSLRTARWVAGESVARLTGILLCLSPFVVAVAGSEMSHLPAAALAMTAAALATGAGGVGRPSSSRAILAGVVLGLMTTLRPLDAVAAALPVAIVLWLAGSGLRGLALAAVGGAAGCLPTLWFNAATTGSWHVFGYTYLWGPDHSLGFHPVPWGVPLTLARAVARSGLDLHQLNTYLFDAPVPMLPVVAVGWVVGRHRLGPRDAVPVVGVLALVAALFAYWHRDVFYGPRFLFGAVPWLVILVARAVGLLRGTGRPTAAGEPAGAIAALAVVSAVALGVFTITPGRVRAYRDATPIFDLHPDRDAARAGIHHAVVVVPDGWGSRLIVRMWAAGVPVPRSTRLYADIDACAIERALGVAEAGPARSARLVATLDSLAARDLPGVPAGLTDDANLRLLPGDTLAPACRDNLVADRRGFLAYAPFLWLNTAALDGDIVWARDLGPGNAPLFARYAGRSYYRYAPDERGGRPVFTPLQP